MQNRHRRLRRRVRGQHDDLLEERPRILRHRAPFPSGPPRLLYLGRRRRAGQQPAGLRAGRAASGHPRTPGPAGHGRVRAARQALHPHLPLAVLPGLSRLHRQGFVGSASAHGVGEVVQRSRTLLLSPEEAHRAAGAAERSLPSVRQARLHPGAPERWRSPTAPHLLQMRTVQCAAQRCLLLRDGGRGVLLRRLSRRGGLHGGDGAGKQGEGAEAP